MLRFNDEALEQPQSEGCHQRGHAARLATQRRSRAPARHPGVSAVSFPTFRIFSQRPQRIPAQASHQKALAFPVDTAGSLLPRGLSAWAALPAVGLRNTHHPLACSTFRVFLSVRVAPLRPLQALAPRGSRLAGASCSNSRPLQRAWHLVHRWCLSPATATGCAFNLAAFCEVCVSRCAKAAVGAGHRCAPFG